jgi:GNAT superfamily N-acetyltransferase
LPRNCLKESNPDKTGSSSKFPIRDPPGRSQRPLGGRERRPGSLCLPRAHGKPPGPTFGDYGALIAQGLVSVAEDEHSEIAAVVVLMPKTDHLLLDNVAVRPDRQGQGYGRRMITFAESEARRLGFAELDLYTHEKMVENIALYTRLGFVESGRGEQAGYSRVFMTKLLS